MKIDEIGKTIIGFIEGGDKDDPDPEHMGRVRVRLPSHGKLVQTSHLPFTQILSHAQGMGQHEHIRPPRPGQMISFIKDHNGYGYISGIFQGIQKNLSAGGKNFENLIPQIKEAMNKDTGIRIPPEIKTILEENRSGLQKMVKQIQEKSELDKQALYKGVPSHGASPSLANLISQPLKAVSTALNEFENVLSSDILSQLPGQFFSLGNIFEHLTDEVKNNLPDDIQDALSSMQVLMPREIAGSLPGNFTIGGIVNPTNIANALLSKIPNVKNFGQLENVFGEIQNMSIDSSILDGLANISINFDGIFGSGTKSISPLGVIESSLSSLASQAESAFSSLLGNIPSAQNKIFGSDSKIPDLMKRLKSRDIISEMKSALEQKSPSKNSKRDKLYSGGSNGTTRGTQVIQ